MENMQVDNEFDIVSLKRMVQKLYDLKHIDIKRLNSYDDQTYHVTLKNDSGHLGYILKITNPIDSAVNGLLEGQIALISHIVRKNTVRVPELIVRQDGKLWAKEDIREVNGNAVNLSLRMIQFHPGKLLSRTSVDPGFLYDLGATVAKLHIAMSDFSHPVFKEYKTHWSMERFMESQTKVQVLQDDNKKLLANNTYEEFRDQIIPRMKNFSKGQLHGDINENNILVVDEGSRLRVGTVLDWGDTHYSCIIFDIAITIAYMLLYVKDMQLSHIGLHILNGYRQHKDIPNDELQVLVPCVKSRLTQSLVLGYYTYQCNPGAHNMYVLETQTGGWLLLQRLQSMDKNQLLNAWK